MNTIDHTEIKKFSQLASEWWDESGPFKYLHLMNHLRIPYIKDHTCKHYDIKELNQKPLKGLEILDIGCGGGILSVPLSRLGANVTGIDASAHTINIAKSYSSSHGHKINYQNISIERCEQKFDIICALEIIEHVADVRSFLKHSISCLNQNGLLFISTISKTIESYFKAIIAAEYLLRIVPVKTHHWNKFITPGDLIEILEEYGMKLISIDGMSLDVFRSRWVLSKNLKTNYITVLSKN